MPSEIGKEIADKEIPLRKVIKLDKTDSRCLKNGEYYNTYFKVFAFHKRHMNPDTDEDWLDCVTDLDQFKTPFEAALMIAVLDELERDFKSRH